MLNYLKRPELYLSCSLILLVLYRPYEQITHLMGLHPPKAENVFPTAAKEDSLLMSQPVVLTVEGPNLDSLARVKADMQSQFDAAKSEVERLASSTRELYQEREALLKKNRKAQSALMKEEEITRLIATQNGGKP